jgi:hypothetical protein
MSSVTATARPTRQKSLGAASGAVVAKALADRPIVRTVRTKYAYTAAKPDEVSFAKRELLDVLRDDPAWLLCRKADGTEVSLPLLSKSRLTPHKRVCVLPTTWWLRRLLRWRQGATSG